MAVSNKLVAIAASTAVLIGGATATFVTATAQPAPAPAVAVAVPVVETKVRVVADNQTHDVSLATPTVAAALSAAGVTVGAQDRVDRALDAVLAAGDSVTVQRVTTVSEVRSVELAFATTKKNDANLDKGKTTVKTKGVAGLREDTVSMVKVDGVVESEAVTGSKVVREPVNQVILVGTKVAVTTRSATRPPATKAPTAPAPAPAPAPGGAIDLSRADMWDRIAKCESGGNWSINTGNGYYGGLQFALATWRGVRGTDFAAYPHQASRAEQITVANRLYAQRGLQPWGCRHAA